MTALFWLCVFPLACLLLPWVVWLWERRRE